MVFQVDKSDQVAFNICYLSISVTVFAMERNKCDAAVVAMATVYIKINAWI